MTCIAQTYPYETSLTIDDEGHRDYDVRWKVASNTSFESPDYVMMAAGLPLPGTPLGAVVPGGWPFAYFLAKGSCRFLNREQTRYIWDVSTPFTTRGCRRCMTTPVGNPLMEPWKISGGGNKYVKAALRDKDDQPIVNSAGQRFRGEVVQIDESHATFSIAGNVAWINLTVLNSVRNAVNDSTWWGHAARTIKCTDFRWEQRWFSACQYFFAVNFAFEINDDTWDLEPLDEGDLVKDPDDATKWMVPKDAREQTLYRVLLDGHGAIGDPANPVFCNGTDADVGPFRVRKEVNFASIGFPASFPGLSIV